MLLEKWRVNSRVNPACFTSLLPENKTSLYWQTRSRICSIGDCPKAESSVELVWQQGLPPGLFSDGDGLGEPFGRVLGSGCCPTLLSGDSVPGKAPVLIGIFWNGSSKFLHAALFVHKALLQRCLLQQPFCLHQDRKIPCNYWRLLTYYLWSLKICLITYATRSVLELFVLTSPHLPEKNSFF